MSRIATIFAFLCFAAPASLFSSPINPIVGDDSYYMRFKEWPDEHTNEQVRIQTHLAYAEFLLRSKDVSAMSAEQKEKRNHTLDLLHEYWSRGIFPHNYDYAGERKPCFIDQNGNICAVGYLVEQTAGRDAAEIISSRHKYEVILDMKDQLIYDWVESTGLTLEELAIIQPSYTDNVRQYFAGVSYRVSDNFYPTIAYGITEALWEMKGGDVYHNGTYLTFDWLYHRNFSGGLRFVRPIPIYALEKITPIIALKTEGFHYGFSWGMIVAPEAGFVIGNQAWSFRLSYAYDFPLIAANKYEAGRHDLTFGVAFIPARVKSSIFGTPQRVKF